MVEIPLSAISRRAAQRIRRRLRPTPALAVVLEAEYLLRLTRKELAESVKEAASLEDRAEAVVAVPAQTGLPAATVAVSLAALVVSILDQRGAAVAVVRLPGGLAALAAGQQGAMRRRHPMARAAVVLDWQVASPVAPERTVSS